MNIDNEFIIHYVANAVFHFPDHVALIDADSDNKSITYREMWDRVTILASRINDHFNIYSSLSPTFETPLVSIMMNRGFGVIISILAALKAGAAYVPVDPSFPIDRQEYIFNHSKSQLLLTDEENFSAVKSMGPLPPVFKIESSTGYMTNSHSNNTVVADLSHKSMDGEQIPVYILYTSGSTGKPKGVIVQNKGLVNIIRYFVDDLKVSPTDKVLGLTTLCFDISMLELYMPLISGAALVLVSAKTQKNPFRILDVINQHKVSIVQATPTTYEMLIACDWSGDKSIHFLVGGEAIRPKVAQLALNSRSLTNVYGPTETTIWSSSYILPNRLEELQALATIPIGAPISQTYFYIVDDNLKLLPDGQEGELLIGGVGVALGYIHAPDLTEKRFFPNPYGDPGRVYRTGDLCSKLPDGTYAFARRLDDQVKVNGYRIELGEVELTMSNHPTVAQAVVIVKDDMLVGYVLLKRSTANSETNSEFGDTENDIKKFVGESLPKYMIPKYVIPIDEIPKTANGKLDRLTLSQRPLPSGLDTISTKHQKISRRFNQDDTSAISMLDFVLQKVFEVSGREPSPHASFASVGVDSLAAVIFRQQLSKCLGGISIDQDKLYDSETTISDFSIYLYERLQNENSQLLASLNITCALNDSNRSDEANRGDTVVSTSLNNILLVNRKLFDGFRGILIIYVLWEHLFKIGNNPSRIKSDTYMFLVLTGIQLTLQSLAYAESKSISLFSFPNFGLHLDTHPDINFTSIYSSQNKDNSSSFWNASKFFTVRFVGMFPLYYSAILLCVPRLMKVVPLTGYSQSELAGVFTLWILALNTWTDWCAVLLTDLYYVSYLWGIFIIYAMFMSNYYSSYLSPLQKIFGVLLIIGFIIGMAIFASVFQPPRRLTTGGSLLTSWSPTKAFAYFVIGAFGAYGLAFFYSKITFMNPKDSIVLPVVMPSQEETTLLKTNTSSAMISKMSKHVLKGFQRLKYSYITRFGRSDFIWAMLTDLLAFFFFWFMFFNNYGNSKDIPNNTVKSSYDKFFAGYGFSIYLTIFAPICMLNPYGESIFTFLLKDTMLMTLLGECSLPIYLYHVIISQYLLIPNILFSEGSIQKVSVVGDGFARMGKYQNDPRKYGVVIVVILFSIFMQKVFQDIIIMRLYSYITEYFFSKTSLSSKPNKTTRAIDSVRTFASVGSSRNLINSSTI